MDFKLLLAVIILIIKLNELSANQQPIYDLSNAPAMFQKLMMSYDGHYKNDIETKRRYHAFVKILQLINQKNELPPGINGLPFDISQLVSWTDEEFENWLAVSNIQLLNICRILTQESRQVFLCFMLHLTGLIIQGSPVLSKLLGLPTPLFVVFVICHYSCFLYYSQLVLQL